jgi:hypothetical protein
MDFNQRQECTTGKLKNYAEEVSGLAGAGVAYQLVFGFLLLFLLPVLILEILLVLLFGKDIHVFIRTTLYEPPKLIEEEVPESLRDLIPLARKFGVGDDADRDEIMESASPNELAELEKKVMPRQQEISDWLDTFPEGGMTDTAVFFLYLGSACDEVPQYIAENKT